MQINRNDLISYLDKKIESWNERFYSSPIHYDGMFDELWKVIIAIEEIKQDVEFWELEVNK